MSVRDVFALSDEAAFDLFRELRWGNGEEVVCPDCGVVERHWFLPSRRQWRCKAGGHTFSVTSGTIFAHHKLPLRVYLGAVAIYTNAVKGLSALQMCRDLGVQYKSAFVLTHKLRESLLVQREETPLCAEVEIDGAYVGGHVRPQNKKEERVDRRLAENQSPDKRCILVMRENPPKGDGASTAGHRGQQPGKSRARLGRGAALTLVLIDHHDRLARPASRQRPVEELVLPALALQMLLNLARGGLPHVHIGHALQMVRGDLGGLLKHRSAHRLPPSRSSPAAAARRAAAPSTAHIAA